MKRQSLAKKAKSDAPHERRCKRLRSRMSKESLTAMLVTDDANVHYLTGFTGEDSWLVVTRDRAILVSDARFAEQIAGECPDLECDIRRPGAGRTIVSQTAQILEKLGVNSIGFEGNGVTFSQWEGLKGHSKSLTWAPQQDMVESLRAVKDAGEIAALRRAVEIAEKAFAVLRASITAADTEKELGDMLDGLIRKFGGTCSAFPPIVAVGERAALAHARPTEKRCEESELLLVDWGARANMYNSDLTRVLVFGKATAKLAKIYDVVLRAQMRAIEAIRPGALCGEIDRIARSTIEEAGFGRYFGHSLGHGLGLRVHEAPGLRTGSEVPLEPGMVVTVEPGVYLEGWGGIRIEDDVLVTKDGHEVLTSVPKAFDEVVLPR